MAPVPVPGLLRLAIEIALFTFTVLALLDLAFTGAGLILGLTDLIHYALSYDRIIFASCPAIFYFRGMFCTVPSGRTMESLAKGYLIHTMQIINIKLWNLVGTIPLFLVLNLSCSGPYGKSPQSIVNGTEGAYVDSLLTPFIEEVVSTFHLPGLAIGVVARGQIVYARAFGFENVETKEPVTLETMFHMASIPKPFVATAIMQLVERGKIDLEETVVTYLPYFRLEGGPYDSITIGHMLTHVSGMPDVKDYQWDKPVYDEDALETYVRSIASEKMLSSPGDKYAYSNMAYECLGEHQHVPRQLREMGKHYMTTQPSNEAIEAMMRVIEED
jgi:hypothetical protein